MSRLRAPAEAGERALAQLAAAGLVSAEPVVGPGADTAGRLVVTAAGEDTAQRLIEERRASLWRLCAGLVREENPELAARLTQLARDLAREPRAHDSPAPVTVSAWGWRRPPRRRDRR